MALFKKIISGAFVWNDIRLKQDKVEWHKLIWFQHHSPKHSLIAWMTILNRLPTKDRLKAWELEVEEQCCFCQQGLESRDHVFFG